MGEGAFVIGLIQISSFFSFKDIETEYTDAFLICILINCMILEKTCQVYESMKVL